MKFDIHWFDELPSTNSKVRELAESGAAEGLVVAAKFQSAGRGKPGNVWVSSPGKNLLFTLLIRPQIQASETPILTQIACRSVASALKKEYGIESKLKRPNDILVNNDKICGILVESSSSSSGALEYAMIGIGLNVNEAPAGPGIKATCMKTVTASPEDYNANQVLNQILKQLDLDLKGIYEAAT